MRTPCRAIRGEEKYIRNRVRWVLEIDCGEEDGWEGLRNRWQV